MSDAMIDRVPRALRVAARENSELQVEVERLRAERDAYARAKQENDERFQLQAAEWRDRYERLRDAMASLPDRIKAECEAQAKGYRQPDEADYRAGIRWGGQVGYNVAKEATDE